MGLSTSSLPWANSVHRRLPEKTGALTTPSVAVATTVPRGSIAMAVSSSTENVAPSGNSSAPYTTIGLRTVGPSFGKSAARTVQRPETPNVPALLVTAGHPTRSLA